MEEHIHLTLNREQRSHLFAHLLVYLFSLPLNHTIMPRDNTTIEVVQDMTYRLHQGCLQQSEQTTFQLSRKEGFILRSLLSVVKSLYDHWPESELKGLALEHLSTCLVLLQEATRQVGTNTKRKEDDGRPGTSATDRGSTTTGGAEASDNNERC